MIQEPWQYALSPNTQGDEHYLKYEIEPIKRRVEEKQEIILSFKKMCRNFNFTPKFLLSEEVFRIRSQVPGAKRIFINRL